jgi:hypothetical protein
MDIAIKQMIMTKLTLKRMRRARARADQRADHLVDQLG